MEKSSYDTLNKDMCVPVLTIELLVPHIFVDLLKNKFTFSVLTALSHPKINIFWVTEHAIASIKALKYDKM
jgi:competence transcription factor ComK